MKKTIWSLLIFVLLFPKLALSQNLPEFFGCYIQDTNNELLEISQNEYVGSTGWFVKQERKSSGDAMKDFQSMLSSGGDLGAALSASSNIKYFLTTFSESRISLTDLKGFILYGEFKVGDIRLFKLTNRSIPQNATFVEYKGPQPIDKSKMWLPYNHIELRSKPIQEKMYFVKSREPLSCGCYAFLIDGKFYDFKVKSSSENPIIGVYNITGYRKEKGIFGDSYIIDKSEAYINEINRDGKVIGILKRIDIKTNKIASEEPMSNITIDLVNQKIICKEPDESKEGVIYGTEEGFISIKSGGECDCGSVSMKLDFKPYEKYMDHEFLKENTIYWEWVKI